MKSLETDALVKCPTVLPAAPTPGIANVSNYANVSNLNTNSWVYGNTTEAEYFLKLFKFMTSNNVTNCPVATPYVLAGTTYCSACPASTPVFDVSSQKCISCPNLYAFNSTTHQC